MTNICTSTAYEATECYNNTSANFAMSLNMVSAMAISAVALFVFVISHLVLNMFYLIIGKKNLITVL